MFQWILFSDFWCPHEFFKTALGCTWGSSNHLAGLDQAMLGAGPRIWHYAQNCWRPCGSRSGDLGDEETLRSLSTRCFLVVGDHLNVGEKTVRSREN